MAKKPEDHDLQCQTQHVLSIQCNDLLYIIETGWAKFGVAMSCLSVS